MFLRYRSEKLDNHSIHPEWRLISNHTLLMICIPIFEEHIQTKKCSLVKDSYEEKKFINELINYIHEINMSNISDIISFKSSVQTIAHATESLWAQYSKIVNITKHSKSWWDSNCNRDLEKYRSSKYIEDWRQFRNTVKKMK